MLRRVVVTGLGVAAPNGNGIPAFKQAIQSGKSGIRHFAELEKLLFSCQIAGRPEVNPEIISQYLSPLEQRNFNSTGILYGLMAGLDAWDDAGLPRPLPGSTPDYNSGTIFGAGTSGIEKFRESIYKLDEGQMRKLGSTVVVQTMLSGISAWLGGRLGLGNQVSTNSSACITGTESILMGFERILAGRAERMLCGSTTDSGPYIWAGFDAMKVCTYRHNADPEKGSRPMSASASGFVPGAGAGALLLESLESAQKRSARIYAEVLGGHINSGGQLQGGSMTAPNPAAVQACIGSALATCQVRPEEIDVISGHLTATARDPDEIDNWSKALGLEGDNFPYVQALKSMIGHCLSAAGSIECVALALQIFEGFLCPNLNSEDLHGVIAERVSEKKIPRVVASHPIQIAAKASFGFGDVNACLIFKKFQDG